MGTQGVFTTGNLSSYCTVEDVFKVLCGYDLTPFGGEEELAVRVQELLPLTHGMVDSGAGRDFRWHADETVTLDGKGTDRLLLTEAGVGLPAQVAAVRVAGASIQAEGYHVYPETGLMRLKRSAPLARFPEGVQNVAVDLDWGFEQTPTEVALAQAKLTAAELLAELGGEGGAVRETRIGDYAVRYAAEGRYGGAVGRLCAEAQEILRRYRAVRMAAV
jgi:hypothetical protein